MLFRRSLLLLPGVALCVLGPSDAVGQLGSRSAEGWIERLSRPERIKQLRIDEVIEKLGLEAGDVVADIGAGAGVFSLPFGKALSDGGKVYAVEVDRKLVEHIAGRARDAGAANVEAVLGEFTDPKIPERDIDLAFFHDVLHHVEDRTGYLKTLADYIASDGRIAVIEGGAHRGPGDHGHMDVSKDQVTAWMAEAGFEPSEEPSMFEEPKWFVIYSRR